MQDVCGATSLSIVDEILSCRDALHASGEVSRRLARVRMLAKQPESFRNPVDDPVCDDQVCATGPTQ
jgi:hypothetical protein